MSHYVCILLTCNALVVVVKKILVIFISNCNFVEAVLYIYCHSLYIKKVSLGTILFILPFIKNNFMIDDILEMHNDLCMLALL